MAADGKWVRRSARTVVDGASATAWLEMDGEKKPLVMSELGCADGCGRQMGAEYPQVQEGLEWFAYRSKFSRSRMFFFSV